MIEEWRDIKDYEGCYQVSNLGRVKSLGRYSIQKHWIKEKILPIRHNNSGYCDVDLYLNGKRKHKKVHRLVADAFIPNINNLPEVDHIDTNKDNNCVSNLKWVTHSENHLNPLTVQKKREINLGKKLSKETVEKMSKKIAVYKNGIKLKTFKSYKDLDENSKAIFGITLWNDYVRKVINGERKEYHGYTFTIEK